MALVKKEDLVAQFQGFGALPAVKQVGLMIGLAASIALGVAVVIWSQSPNYSLLFANLSGQDLASVATSLDDAGIPYRIEHGSGSILVPATEVHDLRLRLAARGLPESEETGFELLDKETGFGTSRFLEKARYQRALEGELTRTIDSISAVEGARVHLAIPKQSVFVRDRARPSASVLVKLRPGGKLTDSQIAGIVHLLAASVPGLEPEAVTVVDQKGRLLSETGEKGGMALNASQFEYSRRIEEEYTRRIREMLAPIVGASGVRAQVTADLDFTVVEETREAYRPDQTAVRSEEVREQQNIAGDPMGVPGALTNQPPRGGTLNDPGGTGETNRSSSKEVVRNYEVDRTISHSRFAPGQIKRLSVAVMLDYRKRIGEDGKLQQTPLEEAEITRLTELVKKAVGFDPSRNDTINVINMPFQGGEELEPMEELAFWQQPWLWELAKPVLGALFVLFLGLGVLRPTLKNLAETGHIIESEANSQRLPAVEGAGGVVAGLPMPEDQLNLSGDGASLSGAVAEDAGASAQSGAAGEAEEEGGSGIDIEMARSLVQQDPRRVAQVMKSWVAADE